jgi:hypothetical protein
MEFQSDYGKVAHLMEMSEDIENIYFEEYNHTESAQTGAGSSVETLGEFEREFYEIFNKAKEYRQRLNVVESNMQGGAGWDKPLAPSDGSHTRRHRHHGRNKYGVEVVIQEPDDDGDDDDPVVYNPTGGAEEITSVEEPKKKRGGRPEFMKFLELVSIMSKSGKYPDIKRKHLMKIAKIVMDEAKKEVGSNVEAYSKKANELAVKDASKFIKIFNEHSSSAAPAARIRSFY